MKRRNLQKFSAIVLAGAMAMSLMAVGVGAEDAAEGSAPNWEPFAENVTIKIPVYDRGVEGVPDVTNNYWTQWVQENFGDKYNITVEYVAIPRTDVMTQYTLLASSQDLPTILMEYDYDKLGYWANEGYLAELDLDLFKEIAPTYYARMEENNQLDYVALNGTNYFALALRPYYNTGYTYVGWVRMDWLEQVGYDHIPANRAEYLDAMQKIMDAGIAEHPGYGSMLTAGQGADQNYAYREHPFNEEEWAMYGDYNIPSLGWSANYNLLKDLNEDYNAGILDPEYYTIDTETAKANFINGKTYEYYGYISANMDWLTAFYQENPDAHLAVKVQTLEEDTEAGITPAYRSDNPFGMMVGFSSLASEDEIKAAMMYMEWMTQDDVLFTMQWGLEGEHFNYDENGEPVSVDYEAQATETKQGYNNNKDYWCVTIEARNASTIEETIKVSSPQGLPEDFYDQLMENYNNKVKAAEAGWAVADCMFGQSIESAAEYQAGLQSLYVELRDKLVTAPTDQFDALYEEYSQQYLDAGYQEVIDERKEVFDAGLTTRLQQ